MTLQTLKTLKRTEILRLATIHGASNVRLFGLFRAMKVDQKATLIFWTIWPLAAIFSILADCRPTFETC